MADKDKAMKRTGDMLLSGWKMLSMACPICHSPLMSKQDQYHCPGCDLPIMTQSYVEEKSIKYSPSAGLGRVAASVPAEEVIHRHTAEKESRKNEDIDTISAKDLDAVIAGTNAPTEPKFQSLEEAKKEYDKKNRINSDYISSKIGEHLLLGYTMLALECPQSACKRTPLMKMKDSTPLCVSCGNHFEMDSYGAMNKVGVATKQTTNAPEKSLVGNSIKPSSYDEAKLELVEPPVMLDPYRNSADISKSNSTDPSRLIAAKLLQGWALLDETCLSDSCIDAIPLLKDVKGEKYCVVCGYLNSAAKVVSRGESKSAHQVFNPKNNVSSRVGVGNSTPVALYASGRNNIGIGELGDEEDSDDQLGLDDDSVIEKYKEKRRVEMLQNELKYQPASKLNSTNTGKHDVFSKNLLKKLQWACSELESSSDITRCLQLSELVSKLSVATSDLLDLESKLS